jgi:hypothetical protein
MTTCNSPYFYVVSAIAQIARVPRVATHYVYDAIHCNSIEI